MSIKASSLCILISSVLGLSVGCYPCAGVHCAEDTSTADRPADVHLTLKPTIVISATLGGLSRLAARWRIQQQRARGVRRGTRVSLEDGNRALLAVTAMISPLRLDTDPSCSSCVLLQGTMPLKVEVGRGDGANSSLREHSSGMTSRWSLSARLEPSWTSAGLNIRAIADSARPTQVELRWNDSHTLDPALEQAALGLAREAVSAEVMRAASELIVLQLARWPGAEQAFPVESIDVQLHAPLLRVILRAPLAEGLDAESIQPGIGQDLTIAVSTEFLAHKAFTEPVPKTTGTARLVSLGAARRALQYRVHATEDSSYFQVTGVTVPGRRGAKPVFDLLQTPRLLEAGGSAGHHPPSPERQTEAVATALRPLRLFASRLQTQGPGGVSSALMIARYESGALLLEAGFTDPRAKPSGPPPAHRAAQTPNSRHPTPRLRAVDPRAHQRATQGPPQAHPAPQSDPPATR
jgi:hypothetical protein